ncbi:MAG: hypothetical protein ACREXU_19700, partial [Gammaproteobacteria bacterium]
YRLRAPRHIIAFIGGLHPRLKKGPRRGRSDPCQSYAGKALKDQLAGLRSFLIWHVRIVHRIAPSRAIDLVAIGPRERIYEATYRLIAKQPDPGRCGRLAREWGGSPL